VTSFTRFAGVAIVALSLASAGCGEGQPQAKGAPPPAVTVAKPVRNLVVDQDQYVGRFVAIDSVEIRARVGGYLNRINFTDGQMVKEGDTLFVIDRRPYRPTRSSRPRPNWRRLAPTSFMPRVTSIVVPNR
jgi:multidrug efflux pump subunit AcrA (membrane-fusion protein)